MALTAKWTDPRGVEWDLTRGDKGIVLDLGNTGLGWSDISHEWANGGLTHTAAKVGRGDHVFKILMGANLDSPGDFYSLSDEWWNRANSPFETGTLEFQRPDGTTRSRELRLASSPDTSYEFDPGIGADEVVEAWHLTGDGAFWRGPEQRVTIGYTAFTGGSGIPFYGTKGAGWPLYIAEGARVAGQFVSNDGAGPMWLTYHITGPISNVTVGVEGQQPLALYGDLLDGESVVISTDPETRGAWSPDGATSYYSRVSGPWLPVPRGDRLPLNITADGVGENTRISVYGRTMYATAF